MCFRHKPNSIFIANKQIHEIVGWERGMRWYRATQCQCNNLNTLTYIYISFVIHFDWNARAGRFTIGTLLLVRLAAEFKLDQRIDWFSRRPEWVNRLRVFAFNVQRIAAHLSAVTLCSETNMAATGLSRSRLYVRVKFETVTQIHTERCVPHSSSYPYRAAQSERERERHRQFQQTEVEKRVFSFAASRFVSLSS